MIQKLFKTKATAKAPRISLVLEFATLILFLVASLVLVVFVNSAMRDYALEKARDRSRLMLDRNLAIHEYFNDHLKPRLFERLDQGTSLDPSYFDPVWMSSTYAVREINRVFSAYGKKNDRFYYKEAAVNARNPGNEADAYERAFLDALRSDENLNEWSGVREIDGRPYFQTLMRGESMEAPCLRCHRDPDDAPADLVAQYGPERSFDRFEGQVVSALSMRIPLAAAYDHADAVSRTLCGAIAGVLLVLLLLQWIMGRWLIVYPLNAIRNKVVAIAHDDSKLGEKVGRFATREFNEVAAAFNSLMTNLKHNRDTLESRVDQRTDELREANRLLEADILERQAVENALKESSELNASIINSLHDEMIVIDAKDYRILLANREFLHEANLGDEQEVLGRTCHEVIHGFNAPCSTDGSKCSLVKSVMAGKEVLNEVEDFSQDMPRFKEVTAFPIKNAKDEIHKIIHISRDVTERKEAENRISELAYYDPLTGLPNRLLFLDRLEQSVKVARRKGKKLAVLFIDLDRFKNINDSLGHHVGDELLTEVARLMEECTRNLDTVARLSGDEFAIILEDIEKDDSAALFSHKVLGIFSEPVTVGAHQIHCSCSVGIALYPRDAATRDALMKNADIAMYEAKAMGRNCYHFFSEDMNDRALKRMELENGIRRALLNEEFFLCFQPQISLDTGRITHLETLLRWQDPVNGLISPGDFIPIAEETALILSIDEWVLRNACRQCRIWRDNGNPDVKVAVNISGLQFKQSRFIDLIDEVLTETGLPPDCLELELTEGHLMSNIESTVMTLTDLKVRKIGLAIDDFGTGYSSLSYLKNFPIDRVKIDRSFVDGLLDNDSDRAIVEAIIALACNLDMEVIAEGVETLPQVKYLRGRNCLDMQGYFFSRPCRIEELLPLLKTSNPYEKYTDIGCD
ncbi:MAG: EAL domain-containing protein [Desulfuromonadales bacterium]